MSKNALHIPKKVQNERSCLLHSVRNVTLLDYNRGGFINVYDNNRGGVKYGTLQGARLDSQLFSALYDEPLYRINVTLKRGVKLR